MEYHGLPIYNMTLTFGDDVGSFDFNNLASSLPAGGSAASTASSSYAPSSHGPQAPTSGRSTPPLSTSFDFGSSFASSVDTVPFDLTPPSSATSTYFPMTPRTGSFSDSVCPIFPVTPSRQLDFTGHPFNICANQLTPSHTMDYGFVNPLGSFSVMSTSSVLSQSDHLLDTASLWVHPDSPISFDQSPTRSTGTAHWVKHESEDYDMDTTASTARRRALMAEVRQKTTALQLQVEQGSPSNTRVRAVKRERKTRAAVTASNKLPLAKIERAGAFKCPLACSNKVYRRKEHMMRHVRTKHQTGDKPIEWYTCDWCEHGTDLKDNFMEHLKLHTKVRPKTGSSKPRRDFFPGAVVQYERMLMETRQRRRPGTKTKKRAGSSA